MKNIRSIKLLAVVIIFFGFTNYIHSQVDDYIMYWSFDNLDNDQFEEHVNPENSCTVYGCRLINGVKGKALDFDGINDYAKISGNNELPPEILKDLWIGSISIWFKVDNIPDDNSIAPIFYYGANHSCAGAYDASNDGIIIEVGHDPVHYGSKRLYFTVFSRECSPPIFCFDSWIDIEESKWYHFVVTVGVDFNKGYLNGEEMTYRNFNFGTAASSQFFSDALKHEKFWLGKGHWDGRYPGFDGAIDEIKIYNRPLSNEDVEVLYKQTDIPTSNISIEKDILFEIYPSLVKDNLFVNFELNKEIEYTLKIYNIASQSIGLQTKLSQPSTIFVNDLKPGLYQMLLYQKSKLIETRKFVKL